MVSAVLKIIEPSSRVSSQPRQAPQAPSHLKVVEIVAILGEARDMGEADHHLYLIVKTIVKECRAVGGGKE